MEDGKRTEVGFGLVNTLILLSAAGLTGAVTWLFRESDAETIRNVVINITGSGILIYLIELYKKDLEKPGRILFSYLAGLFVCVCGVFLPVFLIPLLSVGLIFMLLSNFQIGICAYAMFCVNLTLLSSSSADVFFYFFMTGLFAMAVYAHMEEEFLIAKPLIMISCISAALYMAIIILKFFRLTADMIIHPAIGLFLNIFILSIALYVYRKEVVYLYENKYREINDTEYTLLRQLKNENKDAYFLAVHTAHLCGGIADLLGMNADLIKCGAYYRRIGVLLDEKYYEKNRELMELHRFPPDLIQLVEECSPLNDRPKHREALIIRMSDRIIETITERFRKSPQEPVDYKTEIDAIISDIRQKSYLHECNITVYEFEQVQKYFREATLYYDFLR